MATLSWKNITIARFHAANEVLQTDYEDAIDRHIALLAAITDTPEREVLEMPRDEFLEAVKEISFLNDLESISQKFPKWFVLKGRIYKPMQGVDKFTTGQYIDLCHYLKDDDKLANLHKILAVMIQPCDWKGKAHKYNGAKVKELSELFLHNLTMDIAYPIAVFFCNLWQSLTPHILTYLEEKIRETEREIQLTPSLSNTDG